MVADHDALVFSGQVCAENGGIDPRTLFAWHTTGKFPKPDVNVNGRKAWFRSTLQRHREAVARGDFSQERRPMKAETAAA